MSSEHPHSDVLKILRGSEYDKRKSFYKCAFPKSSDYDSCPYVGTLSEVTAHLARHLNLYMYTCQICTREIFDQIEVFSHKNSSNRVCNAGPQNMIAHVPCKSTCVDWWRLRNVYIIEVTEADYNYFKAQQAEIIVLGTSRGTPGTPGYDDDLPPAIKSAPQQTRHRSKSRSWEPETSNRFSENNRSPNKNNPRNSSRPRSPVASNRSHYQNRQSPGRNFEQRSDERPYGSTSSAKVSGSSFSNRRSFTPSNRSFAYNSRPDPQNEQSAFIPISRPRTNPQPSSGWRRSPSPDITAITPTKRRHVSRARSPSAQPTRTSVQAAPFRRGREFSRASGNEQGAGAGSLAIQKPRDMTKERRRSVNYRSPAPPVYHTQAKDLAEISRNQKRFQPEARGTARVVPNRNRMAALLDPHWKPPESETEIKRKAKRLEKLEQMRTYHSNAVANIPQPTKNMKVRQGSTETSTQGNDSPAPVPPPKPVSSHQIRSNFSGFRRSPPSDDDIQEIIIP